ncbi:SRPBCC family protein [Streptomyces spiramyceticus]|uniref:SRPBCC family protein n=1 Tax=Streptomyces spiramyceticus TaxID=299717 RepID=UPI00237AB877|nr:SRPBCC family protein [Streptomyces spiramyceticus]
MDWCHYRFRTVWDLTASPDAVFAVLERAEEYPRWWPQVREATRIDDRTGTLRFRSLLPYELVVTVGQARRDAAAGVLEAAMTGDMDGWARWTVRPHGTGTRAVYEQEVEVRKALVRRFAVPGRPVFIANHALMMRAGRRGLAAALAV